MEVTYPVTKRLLDLAASFFGLLVLAPLFAVIGLLIRIDSEGPVFFLQRRVGRDGKPFQMIKFRTMVTRQAPNSAGVTRADDPRITRVGRFLRRSKLDELPELVNVLRGEMSLVGYRPEIEPYVAHFRPEWHPILATRPGITDIVTLNLADEEALLKGIENTEEVYLNVVMPFKMAIYLRYIENRTLLTDLRVLVDTVKRITVDRFRRADLNHAAMSRQLRARIESYGTRGHAGG